jgi:mRNA-degrading endonuclease RelE of RelBE toxin-antitoxin system
MENKIIPTKYFIRKYKRLIKKFPSLMNELLVLGKELSENPKLGESLGANLYKIRLSSVDKQKGKSGGFRVVTYLVLNMNDSYKIFLITIYDKSEESTINKTYLIKLIKLLIA